MSVTKLKLALLGRGKTGAKVIDLVDQENELSKKTGFSIELSTFHRQNPPTFEALKDKDVILSFLPGGFFKELIPLLIETKKPVVTGSTGFNWPSGVDNTLKTKKLTWVHGSNFALGMNLVKEMIEIMGKAAQLFDKETSFSIHDIHHSKKVDSPSGTALSWQDWLSQKASITSERVGDVVGIHEITLKTQFEHISLKHEALDRKVFAHGALWTSKMILTSDWPKGLLSFSEIAKKELFK
tara:strand:+ start:80 stop:799 length:720 start_codon:yes stop_codon:yes gene_type:complete